MIKKIFVRAVIATVVICSFLETSLPRFAEQICVRTRSNETSTDSSRYTAEFDTCEICESSESEVVLNATSVYSADETLFDNVNLTENENSVDCLENTVVEYECSFNLDDMVYSFDAEIVNDDGDVIATKSIETEAIVTENGGLDACIVIDGETYMLSDYEDSSVTDDCGLITPISVKKVILTYLAVSEAAEKVKAISNNKYNKKLESDGNGVGKDCYVYSQTNKTSKNLKAGNYKFGFTTFGYVGCEVAAAYNAALALGKSERLSETIYFFEMRSIEFSIGWGNLGSNPTEIYRFLKARGFCYKKYFSWSNFENDVNKKTNCYIIMSRWNQKKTNGLHTFFVKKTGSTEFYGYNWTYTSNLTRPFEETALSAFNDGSGFIVGYIVWKD